MGSWLRDYVVHSGVFGPLEASAAASVAAGFAAVAAGLRAIGWMLVTGGVTVLVVLLVANRVAWHRRDDAERRLLLRYCDTLEKRHGRKWAVKYWHQEVDIRSNGDVHQHIAFTIVVRCDELDFCSFTDRTNWDWPVRLIRRVKVKVRSVQVGGEGGTRFGVTTAWLDHRRLKTMVHLDEPALRGEEVSFVVDVFWPAKCAPFMKGYLPDELLVSFGEIVPFAQYVITLPVGYHVRVDKLGLVPTRDDYTLTQTVNRAGQPETTLTVCDIPAYRKVGVKLDLA
ncbi:hypothetical protein FHS29_001056 [Saccharothrix tamanrassetensis]|uniref:Uncharacterized protein n=1 Tax=Saccharothrix tamanrassetensis TaxID=1051531 RepID=A0A841CFK6_9PSEU|nr:hypothetical protein [Saccharothrix tamanrassetensis]MBB5954486.1 hypothetical protein [Saccharothrix tamanrassetensis]